MPIREGSGTGLSAKGFGEVRKGDGTVLWNRIPVTGLGQFYFAPSLSGASTWTDEEGDIDLSAVGSPTLDSGGINGNQAMVYNAADNQNHAANNTVGLGPSSEFTFAAVFNLNDNGSEQAVIEIGDADNGYQFRVDFASGRYQLTTDGVDTVFGGTPDGGDHVVVGSYDGSTMIVDLDKNELFNTSLGAPNAPSAQTRVGTNDDGFDADGAIGAAGHEAAFNDSVARDDITDKLANAFDITV